MDEFAAIEDNLANLAKRLAEDAEFRFGELRKCSFFEPVPDEWLRHISNLAKIRTFSSDERLTTEGGGMEAFYVVLLGSANAYYRDKVVGTIHAGECIGESMFFAGENVSRSATVFADYRIIAAAFDKAGIENLRLDAEAKSHMDKALLLALFNKLQGANRKIAKLLEEIPDCAWRMGDLY